MPLFAAALLATVLTLAAGFQAAAQSPPSAQAPPRDVTFCELAKNPKAFDNARIRITSFINSAFEDFTMWDPTCVRTNPTFALWLTYGGTLNSGAIYCCPGEGIPRAGEAPHPVVVDDPLKQFRALLTAERDTVVRATVTGTLLVKKEDKPHLMSGYGHFGCCSLLVIERVESFDPHSRKDLHYEASSGSYETGGLKCQDQASQFELRDSLGGVYIGPSFDGGERYVEEQRAADRGERAWAFNDSRRVALEAARLISGDVIPSLNRIKSTRAKQVFIWRRGGKVTVIVVTRPYWLSFYAATPRVVWAVTAMQTESCNR